MSKNIKTITKILITVLMVIGILLILPKAVEAISLKFPRIDSNFSVAEDNYYVLAHALINNNTTEIEKWTVGKVVEGNDHGHLVGMNGLTPFINNIFCSEPNNAANSFTSSDKMRVQAILEIYPRSIKYNGTQYVVADEELTTNDLVDLNELAYVLYETYNAEEDWGTLSTGGGDISIRNGQHYFWKKGTYYRNIIYRITGKYMPISGDDDKTNVYSGPITRLANYRNLITTIIPSNSLIKSTTTKADTELERQVIGGKTYVGPVTVESSVAGAEIKVSAKDADGNNITGWTYETYNSKKYFVHNGDVNPNEMSVSVECSAKYAKIYFLYGKNYGQSRIIYKAGNKNVKDTIKYGVEDISVDIKFKKQNMQNESLSGALISISEGSNISKLTDNLAEDKENSGNLGSIKVIPADNNGIFTITMKETDAPTGYNKINDGSEITLTVTYDPDTGDVISISPDKCERNLSFDTTEDILYLKDDSRIISEYTIIKKDVKDNTIANAEFDIYFNGISYVEFNGTRYTVYNDNTIGVTEEGKELVKLELNKKYDKEEKTYYEYLYKGLTITKQEDYYRITFSGLKTNRNGKIVINKIGVRPSRDTVYMKITETEAIGYGELPDPLWLMWRYNNNNDNSWQLFERKEGAVTTFTDNDKSNQNKLDSKYWTVDNTKATITLIDDLAIEELKILKVDEITNSRLKDATFTITLENVKSVGNHSVGGTKSGKIIITGIKTDGNGEIIIYDLVVEDVTKDIKITIKEDVTPDSGTEDWYYKKISNEIIVTLTASSNYKEATKTIKDADKLNKEELELANAELKLIETNTSTETVVTITVKNQQCITLSGMVWQDGQTGNKDVEKPDGINDTDEYVNVGEGKGSFDKDGNYVGQGNGSYNRVGDGLAGVSVRLHDLKTGNRDYCPETYTDENGIYSFVDIPKTEEGYRVVFNYEGIHYQETNSFNLKGENSVDYGKDSKTDLTPMEEYEYYRSVDNTTRRDFNYKFKTINYNEAVSPKDGSGNVIRTPLGYSYESGISTLSIEMDGRNPENPTNEDKKENIDDKDFQMRARTAECTNTTKELDCGLVLKEVDLATTMQVESTTLKINDKTTKYDYSKTVEENLKIANADSLEELGVDQLNKINNTDATTSIEASDYHYRVDDYNNDNTEIKNEDVDKIEKDESKELRVFVTYKVQLINQTIKSGVTINELAYYYDGNYSLVRVGTKTGSTGIVTTDSEIPVVNDKSNRVITVSGLNATSNSDASVIEELYFTFEVNKKDGGLPKAIEKTTGLQCPNKVEITSYSTDNSLIDNDSAPGNLLDVGIEDDSAFSNGLKLVLKSTDRTINGTVFDDDNKNGKLDGEEQKVNNVIVQLIEIKSRESSNPTEYIWQETVTGSNEVKTANRNGYEGEKYRYVKATESKPEGTKEYIIEEDRKVLIIYVNELNKTGEYKFTGFIPGNYIVRYIYGDGTTKDVMMDGNTIKYNGQDYKSTIDPKYNEEFYNNVKSKYAEGASVARDNEARRLEVMAYSANIDAGVGQALNAFRKNMQDLTDEEKDILRSYYESVKEADLGTLIFAYNASEGNPYANEDIPAEITDEKKFKVLKHYVAFKTWMCAETSLINIPVDGEESSISNNSTVTGVYSSTSKIELNNINFGLALRPKTKLVLEKHITGLTITPSGVGVQPIVEASADINQILGNESIVTKGLTTDLSTIKSTRGNRGWWKVETDIEELAQGAELEVEYTYVIRNGGDEDYLSYRLVDKYVSDPDNYSRFLSSKSAEIKDSLKGNTHSYGNLLGQYYYNGNIKTEEDDAENPDISVRSRVETLEEALNNKLVFDSEEGTSGDDFIKSNTDKVSRNVYDTDGNLVDNIGSKTKNIETVVRNTSASESLATGSTDYSKTIKLRTLLSSAGNGEIGINLPSYIAEITSYSNAAGRGAMDAEPENLSYVHSDDTRMTLDTYKDGNVYYQIDEDGTIYSLDAKEETTYTKTELTEIPQNAVKLNEEDEFWGESVIISKPTGEDKETPIQIAIIAISSIAVIGVGIILIKKFVLKK